MHKRDYLVKQFEEFGKVMAILLGLKREGNSSELNDLISESVKKYTSTEIDFVESMINENLIDILTTEKKLNDEQLKILADLLYEKADYYSETQQNQGLNSDAINCYKKSYLIYLFLKEHATLTYSLDMHYKLEILSKMKL
jgi:predicted ATP-grasp superfamily ATP-dependent carboligase